MHYRSTAELLRKEMYHYMTVTGPYRDIDDDELLEKLVSRVEGTVSVDHQVWRQEQLGRQRT